MQPTQPKTNYLRLAIIGLLLAGAMFVGLPFVVHLFAPQAGSYDAGTLNVLALAALEYFAAGHLALWTYKRLLPPFYDELRTCLQDKVLENLTDALSEVVNNPETATAGLLPLLTERRKLLQFKFFIRCVRLVFCLLPLLFLFVLALYALTSALTIVPH